MESRIVLELHGDRFVAIAAGGCSVYRWDEARLAWRMELAWVRALHPMALVEQIRRLLRDCAH